MTPVFQTMFQPQGNCWEACLASLLEVPVSEVPDGRQEGGTRSNWTQIQMWLFERFGQVLMMLPLHLAGSVAVAPEGYYILSGRALTGIPHAVVARAGMIVHDPNPYGGGLETVSVFEVLVPAVLGPALPIESVERILEEAEAEGRATCWI